MSNTSTIPQLNGMETKQTTLLQIPENAIVVSEKSEDDADINEASYVSPPPKTRRGRASTPPQKPCSVAKPPPTVSPLGKRAVESSMSSRKKKPVNIVAQKVNNMVAELFENSLTVNRPCIIPRLIASFVVNTKKTKDELSPSLPLMEAFARAEVTMLGENDERPRIVQFYGFDGSSVPPPVDRVLDSDEKLLQTIEHWKSLKEEIHRTTRTSEPFLEEFTEFIQNDCHYRECAAAISDVYPVERVRKFAVDFAADLHVLLDRLRQLPQETLTPLRRANAFKTEKPMKFVDLNLAVKVGLAIRHQLRVLLNPIPPNITKVGEEEEEAQPGPTVYRYARISQQELDEREGEYSQISQHVIFVDEKGENYCISCLSSTLSTCIRRIYEYSGIEPLLCNTDIDLPTQFCESEMAQRRVPARGRDYTSFPAGCFDEVKYEILEATNFIAACRAAQFLAALWEAPFFTEEVERMGGWGKIETYATILWQHGLHNFCEEDGHLVAFSNIETLVERLNKLSRRMGVHVQAATTALDRVKRNCRFSTTSKNILLFFPEISELKEIYEDGMELARAVPILQPLH